MARMSPTGSSSAEAAGARGFAATCWRGGGADPMSPWRQVQHVPRTAVRQRLSRPSFTRISWIASLVAACPATIDGRVRPAGARQNELTITNRPSSARQPAALQHHAQHGSVLRASWAVPARLHQRAVVLGAAWNHTGSRDVLLHRHVGVGLQHRDARQVGEGHSTKPFTSFFIGRLVADGGGIHGTDR